MANAAAKKAAAGRCSFDLASGVGGVVIGVSVVVVVVVICVAVVMVEAVWILWILGTIVLFVHACTHVTTHNNAPSTFQLAKAATATIYQPVLIASNLVYLLLLVGLRQAWTVWSVLGVIFTWGLQAFSYVGILDQARNNTTKQKDLVGGVHLDILALTITVQYGSVLHSTKWFYLLWVVPLWGGWMLYSTFFKKSTSTLSEDAPPSKSDGASKDKREKRAQKRSQKWA